MHRRLTDSTISKAKAKPASYKMADANGLYLLVQPTGAKLWRYRYRINHKENVFAIGEYFAPPKFAERAEEKRPA